mmetsp:Transcript_16973/g.26394  ORF Transcript_16973/g.26394 Transcript_16973/m.26394 type:complete len:204 (+) Transcript_16973:104-715(+)
MKRFSSSFIAAPQNKPSMTIFERSRICIISVSSTRKSNRSFSRVSCRTKRTFTFEIRQRGRKSLMNRHQSNSLNICNRKCNKSSTPKTHSMCLRKCYCPWNNQRQRLPPHKLPPMQTQRKLKMPLQQTRTTMSKKTRRRQCRQARMHPLQPPQQLQMRQMPRRPQRSLQRQQQQPIQQQHLLMVVVMKQSRRVLQSRKAKQRL